MGSLAVLHMADHAAPSAPGGGRPVHPFFMGKRVAPSDAPKEAEQTDPAPSSEDTAVLSYDGASDPKPQDEAKPKKRRRTKKQMEADAEAQVDSEKEKPRPRKRAKAAHGANILNHFGGVNGMPNPESALDPSVTAGVAASSDHVPAETVPAPEPLAHTAQSTLNTDNASKPKKIMMFNPKTGTIGSPPRPKAPKTDTNPEASEQTLPPGSTNSTGSSKLVRIQYGDDDASRKRIGDKVNAILKTPPKSKPPRTPRKKRAAPRPDPSPSSRIKKSPAKIVHPLFAAKGKLSKLSSTAVASVTQKPEAPQQKRNTIQSSTPCSPKKMRGRPSKDGSNAMPQFSVKSMGLKFPGSKPPAWPWKDMMHVREDDDDLSHTQAPPSHPIPSRKSKGRAVQLSPQDSLIDIVTRRMDVPAQAQAVRNANSDDFLPPPAELRLPTKHFESGIKLQHRILPQLKCSAKILANANVKGSRRKSDSGDMVPDDSRIASHPRQLVRLFNQIHTTLSAFDRADCDNVSWAQKYAPVCAAEVIQPGQEAFILKDWLQALVVQSVDTGAGTGGDDKIGKDKDTKAEAAVPKKRGRKRKKLDDFIVSSDEDSSLMEEVSDNEHDWTPSGKFGIVKKTVIRAGDIKGKKGAKNTARLTNAIVISGPHGCGKTAAVYAVAKELDFEVFEINSSSRRSGKDVDDKIGDMLNYHHVSHNNDMREKPVEKEGDAEAKRAEDELAKDIASGKQKTMASFFTKKTTAPVKKAAKEPAAVSKPAPVPKEAKKDSPKSQKQSLILLDEVDILYDEDKQFWAKVIELIVKSKRPFIMTCNDETLVPLHNLNLHGIFRLSPPPVDLAVDRMLLIAANEGHALQREPIEALYMARNYDLRAATTELNYWCQMGVGDRRGGFDWFYPRWPKGVDLDEHKQVVRVVSEDTYQLGMGWLCRDMVVDKQTQTEEEILQQSWDLWDLDAGCWQDSPDFSSWADAVTEGVTERKDRISALRAYDEFTEAMSAADICSSKSFAQFNEEPIDATTTDLCTRSADDYILGLPMLDAPALIRHDGMSTSLTITLKSMAKAALNSATTTLLPNIPPHLPPLDETRATSMIREHSVTPSLSTPSISRIDFSLAFDPIAASDKPLSSATSYLDPSVLDRNMEPITLDVAPYVRSIVAYDSLLAQQRLRLSNLLSEGGGGGGRRGAGAGVNKRVRTTRSAYSAMSGETRRTTRRDRWFKAELNGVLVRRTGGEGWTRLVLGSGEAGQGDGNADNDAGAGSSTDGGTPSPTKGLDSPGSGSSAGTLAAGGDTPSPVKTKKGRGRPRKVVREDSEDELA